MAATPAQIEYQLSHAYEDRSKTMLGAIITVTVAATMAVGLRLLARRVIRAKIMADDYFTIGALVRRTSPINQLCA